MDDKTELIGILYRQHFEYGMDTMADIYMRELFKLDKERALRLLMDTFIEYYDDVTVVQGILYVVSHYDYNDVEPQGPFMAKVALSHRDVQAQDAGIRAFEGWGTEACLHELKAVSYPECEWLNDYLKQVIIDIESELKK